MQAQRHRPLGVSILAVLTGLAFLANGFIALLFVGALPFALLGGVGFFGQALVGAFFWGLLALIWGWVTVGLWNLDPQAWVFVVALAVLNLILAVISVLGASTWQAVMPGIIVSGIVLVYALTPGVKEAFGVPESRM